MKVLDKLVTLLCGAELLEHNSDDDSSSSTDTSGTFVPAMPSIPTCASVSLERKVSAESSVAYKPTNTVATTTFNLPPPPAYKAPSPPSPYCATSTAARNQQQVNNSLPNVEGDFSADTAQAFLSLTATLATNESLQATLNNFMIGFTPARLQQLNDKILDRTLTPSELSAMPKIISKFSEFIVDNKNKKSNVHIKTSQILNTYTNLLLMYNCSTTNERRVFNNNIELRSSIENVYTHIERRLKALERDPFTNTTQYNAEEHLLIGAQFCFLRLLLDYDSSNFSNQIWDVKGPIDKDFREVPALLTNQLRKRHKEITIKYLPPQLDCILVIRILAVGLLSNLKTDSRYDIPLLKEIYTTLMAGDYERTFPARIKAVLMITELAIRSNDKSAKQQLSALLNEFAKITEYNKKLIEKNKTSQEIILHYKDPFKNEEVNYDAVCKFIRECAKKIENS